MNYGWECTYKRRTARQRRRTRQYNAAACRSRADARRTLQSASPRPPHIAVARGPHERQALHHVHFPLKLSLMCLTPFGSAMQLLTNAYSEKKRRGRPGHGAVNYSVLISPSALKLDHTASQYVLARSRVVQSARKVCGVSQLWRSGQPAAAFGGEPECCRPCRACAALRPAEAEAASPSRRSCLS